MKFCRRWLFLLLLLLAASAGTAPAQTRGAAGENSRRAADSVEGEHRPQRELPLWAVERAYRRAPNDMNWVHAYIRAQVLARTNLTSPVSPRPLPQSIPAQFKFITDAPKFAESSTNVPAAKLLADLDFLEVLIANVYSYADRRGADWRGALDAVRASVGQGLPVHTFALRLHRLLTLFGDPHTRVRAAFRQDAPPGSAPFLPVPDADRVLALRPNRSAFLHDECRYLAAIDGVPLAEWLRVAAYDVAQASPQWTRQAKVEALARIDYLRLELGLALSNQVTLLLASADGTKTMPLVLPVTSEPARRLPRRFGKSRALDGGIGYLRMESMSSESSFLDQLDQSMKTFQATHGLILDVRDNSGGSQDAVKTMLPYLLKPGAPMLLINVAAYRLPVKLPQPCSEGYLPYGRGLHPLTADVWSDEQRQQIAAFLERFEPEWKLPAGKFSSWHVMGISSATNPKAYHYDKPVVVLCDAECFSATDNFLGALKGRPNVTLLGTASGGGSGRMTAYALPNTRLPLTICQMASFRANGDLFDGRGVAPDVVLEATPTDHLARGGDSVLDAALQRLKTRP